MLLGVTVFSYAMAVSSGNYFWVALQNAASQGIHLSPQQIQQLQQYFHLGQPVWEGYFLWLSQILQGNFGITISGQPVMSTVVPWILPTVALELPAILTSALIGLYLGVFSAARHGSRLDRILSSSLAGVLAIPAFWLAIFSIVVFSGQLKLFPSFGYISPVPPYIGGSFYSDMAAHYVLPFSVLVVISTPIYARLARARAVDVMAEEWVLSLRMASVRRSRIVYRHVLRNSMGPVLAALSVNLALFLASSPGIEVAFDWPGLGFGFARAALNYDQPVMMAIILLMALIATVTMVVVDILSAVVDPRVSP
jgi:peptide/nickel transport system permease protein